MKTKHLAAMLTLVLNCTVAFAQNKIMPGQEDLGSAKTERQKDSVYYGCVPCCQKCSVFKTDKPGDCPVCGMTLEKRTGKTDAKDGRSNPDKNKNDCKKQKVIN